MAPGKRALFCIYLDVGFQSFYNIKGQQQSPAVPKARDPEKTAKKSPRTPISSSTTGNPVISINIFPNAPISSNSPLPRHGSRFPSIIKPHPPPPPRGRARRRPPSPRGQPWRSYMASEKEQASCEPFRRRSGAAALFRAKTQIRKLASLPAPGDNPAKAPQTHPKAFALVPRSPKKNRRQRAPLA